MPRHFSQCVKVKSAALTITSSLQAGASSKRLSDQGQVRPPKPFSMTAMFVLSADLSALFNLRALREIPCLKFCAHSSPPLNLLTHRVGRFRISQNKIIFHLPCTSHETGFAENRRCTIFKCSFKTHPRLDLFHENLYYEFVRCLYLQQI